MSELDVQVPTSPHKSTPHKSTPQKKMHLETFTVNGKTAIGRYRLHSVVVPIDPFTAHGRNEWIYAMMASVPPADAVLDFPESITREAIKSWFARMPENKYKAWTFSVVLRELVRYCFPLVVYLFDLVEEHERFEFYVGEGLLRSIFDEASDALDRVYLHQGGMTETKEENDPDIIDTLDAVFKETPIPVQGQMSKLEYFTKNTEALRSVLLAVQIAEKACLHYRRLLTLARLVVTDPTPAQFVHDLPALFNFSTQTVNGQTCVFLSRLCLQKLHAVGHLSIPGQVQMRFRAHRVRVPNNFSRMSPYDALVASLFAIDLNETGFNIVNDALHLMSSLGYMPTNDRASRLGCDMIKRLGCAQPFRRPSSRMRAERIQQVVDYKYTMRKHMKTFVLNVDNIVTVLSTFHVPRIVGPGCKVHILSVDLVRLVAAALISKQVPAVPRELDIIKDGHKNGATEDQVAASANTVKLYREEHDFSLPNDYVGNGIQEVDSDSSDTSDEELEF